MFRFETFDDGDEVGKGPALRNADRRQQETTGPELLSRNFRRARSAGLGSAPDEGLESAQNAAEFGERENRGEVREKLGHYGYKSSAASERNMTASRAKTWLQFAASGRTDADGAVQELAPCELPCQVVPARASSRAGMLEPPPAELHIDSRSDSAMKMELGPGPR